MARAIVKNLGQQVKNYIINGGMTIAQRGVVNAGNNTFLYGGCDRFAVGPFFGGGSSGGQIAQQTFTTGVLTQQMQAVVNLSNTGAGSVQFYTRLEGRDVSRLNGKTITWSMLAYQTSGLTLQFGAEINRPTTTTDDYTSIVSVNSFSTVSVPTHTLTRVTFNHTFSSTAAEKGLELRTYFSVPSTLSTKGYYIGEMQLEESTYRSSLEIVPFEVELAKCQRYYEKTYDLAVAPGAVGDQAGMIVTRIDNNSIQNNGTIDNMQFRVKKRVTPAVTVYSYNGNTNRISDSGGVDAGAGSGGTGFAGQNGFRCYNVSGGAIATADALWHWVASAEL